MSGDMNRGQDIGGSQVVGGVKDMGTIMAWEGVLR